MASTNNAVPTIHNRNSPRRQFIVQPAPILELVSGDLIDCTDIEAEGTGIKEDE